MRKPRRSTTSLRSPTWQALLGIALLLLSGATTVRASLPAPPPRERSGVVPRKSDVKVQVIIYLQAQPVHEAAARVQDEFIESVRHLSAQISESHAAAAPASPGAPLSGLPADEHRARSRALSGQLEATLGTMRREIVRRAQPEVVASRSDLVEWLESVGAVVEAQMTVVNAVAASVPESQLASLRARPDVAEVVENRAMSAHLAVSHYAIGQNVWETHGIDGGAYSLGVLDSGVDVLHPRLDHLAWTSRVCLASAGNPAWDNTGDDVNGHGTHVAGIVVNNDGSQWGIAPGVSMVHNLKAGYDRDGSDGGSASMYWSDMMDCTDWSLTTATDAADVFNLSYGGCSSTMPDDSSAARFWDSVVHDMYAPATISAGNYDPSVPCSRYIGDPAIAYNVLAVANIDDQDTGDGSDPQRSDDVINTGSSLGPTPGGRRKPDLAAPGTDIWSTNNNWEGAPSDWVEYSGTSMAAPHVAGALLLLGDYGIVDPRAQKALLIATSEDKGAAGWDAQYGWGYLDLAQAWVHRNDWVVDTLSPRPDYDLYSVPCSSGDRAALTWNRRAVYNGDSYPSTYYVLSNLDLYLYNEADNALVDGDDTTIDNVHVVSCDTTYSAAVVKVDAWSTSFSGTTSETYALATEGTLVPRSGPAFALGTASYDQCVGDQWTVNVPVTNTGDLAAHGVSVSLSVPPGLSVVSGANPQSLGTINDSGRATASWVLQANSAGSYTVSVDVVSSSYGESFVGSGSLAVDVADAPSAPALTSPANGSSVCDTTPTLDWTAVSGATSYRVQVDDDPAFGSPEVDATTESTSYTPGTPLSVGTHHWRVLASNACGEGTWSTAWSVTVASAPSAPALTSPANGSSACDTTPTLDWTAVSGATSYRVQVDDDPAFGSPEVDATTESTSYTPGTSLSVGTHHWRVLASNACGESAWSAAWGFTMASAPDAPTLTAPTNGSSTCDTTPTLDWAAVGGATSYRVQVDDDPAFGSPEVDATTGSTFYSPGTALSVGTHHWRVLASNACGEGAWSAAWGVTVASAPDAPTLTSPANGSSSCDATPVLDWAAVGGATSYRVQVDDDPAFGSPEVDATTASTFYSPGTALSVGTHHWRVLASNTCGEGTWSTAWSVTVTSAPSAPTLTSPANGSSSCDATPMLDWAAVGGATSYRVQVDDDPAFGSPEVDATTASTFYSPGTALSVGTHHWRVLASNACGEGTWSTAWSVTVTSAPSAPTLTSPAPGSSTCDTTPTLDWAAVGGATSYRVQVDDDPAFGSPEIDVTTGSTSYTPGTVLSVGTHHWRVLASNTCGEGTWSTVWDLMPALCYYIPIAIKNYR